MATDDKGALRDLGVSTFARLKDMVRGLEDDERRLAEQWGPGEVEFRLNADEVAWYVAYKTSMPALTARELATRIKGTE
jgi:hypothetical protein